jgi:hypothetical protein
MEAISQGLRDEGLNARFHPPVSQERRPFLPDGYCEIFYRSNVPYTIYYDKGIDNILLHCPNDSTITLPIDLADPGCFAKLADYIVSNHYRLRRKKCHEFNW